MIKQMTLRQVPDGVEKGLRARAKKTGRSLNRAVIDLMAEALNIRPAESKKRDVSRLAGQWSQAESAAFERNTAVFERIDKETWGR